MRVQVDNFWASPSTLHLRVIVWGPKDAWRHKYDVSVPLEDLEPDALKALTLTAADDSWREPMDDIALF